MAPTPARDKVWDLTSGTVLQTLEGHTEWVNAVTVLPDRRAVSASHDRTLKLWDLASGTQLASFYGDAPFSVLGARSKGVVAFDKLGRLHVHEID